MTARDAFELLVLGVLWGASFLFMRIAGPEFGPFALVEVRVVVATLVLLPLLVSRSTTAELKRNWKMLTMLGVLNTAAPFLLLTYATLYITGGLAAILNATAPIFAAVIAWVWLSDRLNGSRIAGLVLGALGVYALVRDKIDVSFGDTQLAIIAALLASLLYGLGGNFTRRYAHKVRPLAVATGSQLASAIVLLPVAAFTWPSEPVSLQAWIVVIAMGVFTTGVAYILYFRLIANTGPTNAITVTYLIPLFAMILGAVFINETITPAMIAGCTVILLGTALATGMLRLPRRGTRKTID